MKVHHYPTRDFKNGRVAMLGRHRQRMDRPPIQPDFALLHGLIRYAADVEAQKVLTLFRDKWLMLICQNKGMSFTYQMDQRPNAE